MKFLIDGDSLVYRCGFATENEPVENCLQTVKTMLSHIFENSGLLRPLQTYTWSIFLGSTDKSNFRYEVAKTKPYKGNRKAPKPKHYDAIREYLVRHWNAEIVYGMEADDAMGIAQCTAPPGTTVICSNDKDLNMIPGLHWNFVKNLVYTIDTDGALYNFYMQVLTGDSSDNIPGLKGIGPKKAEKILEGTATEREMYDAVLSAYCGNEELMFEMCHLLWIRRKENEELRPPTLSYVWSKEDLENLEQASIDDLEEYN